MKEKFKKDNLLTQEDKDLPIVRTMKAQQMDLYNFQKDLERYTSMLEVLPEGTMRERILQEIPVVESRILEVESIIYATSKQMPSDAETERLLTVLQGE